MRKRWISPKSAAEYTDFSVPVKIGGSTRIDFFTLEKNLEAEAEKNASKYNIRG